MATIYLGRVVRAWRTENDQQLALLEPLARADDERSELQTLTSNVRKEFPNRGRVIWFNAPSDMLEGAHYFFEVKESLTFEPSRSNSDRFMAIGDHIEPHEPAVIVTGIRNGRDLQNRFARASFDALFSPRRIYVEIGTGEIAGPVPFV